MWLINRITWWFLHIFPSLMLVVNTHGAWLISFSPRNYTCKIATWISHEFHVKFTCGDFACVCNCTIETKKWIHQLGSQTISRNQSVYGDPPLHVAPPPPCHHPHSIHATEDFSPTAVLPCEIHYTDKISPCFQFGVRHFEQNSKTLTSMKTISCINMVYICMTFCISFENRFNLWI